MQPKRCDSQAESTREITRHEAANVALRLLVRNHPGVMSHVCGLFHRRLFNVDGIACIPTADPTRSAVLLLVRDDVRLEQIVRQLAKLGDVLEIRRDARGVDAFAAVAAALDCPSPASASAG